MADSKAARIWKRTFIGLGMLALLTAVFSLASLDGGVNVILTSGCILAFFSSLELDRMRMPAAGRWILFHALSIAGTTFVLSREFRAVEEAHGLWGSLLRISAWALLCFTLGLLVHRSGLREKYPRNGGLLLALVLFYWIVLPLPSASLVMFEWGLEALVALTLLSKVGDIAGFYVGNAIGKTRPFPGISPGKTTAGCVASLVAGILFGLGFQVFGLLPEGPFGLATGPLVGGCINLAAQAGDLFESWIKRRAEVKDSGCLFGPAGGVLDMVDSLLFTVPCALLTWPFLL